MNIIETFEFYCPYCGELISTTVDISTDPQQYIEDCSVCCHPIQIILTRDDTNLISVFAQKENL